MDKICLIRQPAGLGDIFFIQKIAKSVGFPVIWPLIEEYLYLSNYLIGENITYVCEKDSFPFKEIYDADPQCLLNTEELLYLPIQHADRFIHGLPVMQVKYKFVNQNYSDWKSYFEFRRDLDREERLFSYYKIDGREFNLINKNFGSKNYRHLKNSVSIEVNNGRHNIEMKYLDFDNVFDWIGLMERASHVYTVDTAWCYLLEKLGKKEVTVYSRNHKAEFFNYVNGIFNPEWQYIL